MSPVIDRPRRVRKLPGAVTPTIFRTTCVLQKLTFLGRPIGCLRPFSGRSLLLCRTPAHAPEPSLRVRPSNGEVGWKGGIPDLPGLCVVAILEKRSLTA